MIEAIIIDDELHAREFLESQISRLCKDVKIKGKASSAEEGIQLIESINPDIVFLDIEMPGKSGFDLLYNLKNTNFKVIFTTGYDQYAIKAIRFSAFDYLLKPIDSDELIACINRVRTSHGINTDQIKTLSENIEVDSEKLRLVIPNRSSFDIIELMNIIYLKGEGNYTKFVLSNQKTILASKTMKEYEEFLPEKNFVRIHKSTIVNMNFVKKYTRGDGGQVYLTTNEIFNVSRSRKADFLENIKSYSRGL